jgi:glycosyltransferase involved in cell wall biosynthesis
VKVLYVLTQTDSIGGASVHLLDLAHGVQAQGHEVVVLAGGNGIFHERARRMGLTSLPLRHLIREIHPLHDLLGLWELRQAIKAHCPDLVHLHSTKAGVLGRLAAWSLRVPAVFTVHGWAFTDGVSARRAALYQRIERFMSPFSRRIITVSEYDRQLALKAGVAPAALMTTVHNGMPLLVEPPSRPHNDTPRLIMVARFDEQKNQTDLLRALGTLNDIHWHAELVGDGPLRPQVMQLAQSLGLADRVEFPGSCNDVAARLARSDVFALVSNWEGLPLSILEAMRAGLPVVASDVGGVAEAVRNDVTGWVVPRGDITALAARLRTLLTSAPLRQQMGEGGHDLFHRQFTFDQMLQKTLQVYRDSLG